MTAQSVTIEVIGHPSPKGSKTARFNAKTGRAWVVDKDHDALKSWHGMVAQAAQAAMAAQSVEPFVDLPLAVIVSFRVQRPGGHYGKSGLKASAPKWPHKGVDLDKYVRGAMDALEGVVFENDARIVQCAACKVYALLGEPEGATITVRSL